MTTAPLCSAKYLKICFMFFLLLFSFSVPQRYKIKRGKSIANLILMEV